MIFPVLPSFKYYSTKIINKLSKADNESHLIFIGSSDLTSTERDISPLIKQITKSKIHIHMAEIFPKELSKKLMNNNNYLHYFKSIPMEELPDFMKSFDGCLVVYNFNGININRLKNGLPNRFFWALAAKIPTFVFSPNEELKSLEEFVKQNKVGITVKNVNELKKYS